MVGMTTHERLASVDTGSRRMREPGQEYLTLGKRHSQEGVSDRRHASQRLRSLGAGLAASTPLPTFSGSSTELDGIKGLNRGKWMNK